jgi:hypothetical protein
VGAKLISEETSAVGSISIDVILKYINAMGGMFWFLLLLIVYIAVELIRMATTVWLSIWTGSTDASQSAGSQATSAFYYLVRLDADNCTGRISPGLPAANAHMTQ